MLPDQLEGSERTRVLEEALMELEADDREVLLVYYREGKSLRQVASLLDLSEPAARKRLSRARARLRSGVEQRLGELAVETAPDERLAMNVMALLPATLSSGASVATAVKAVTSGGSAAVFGAPIVMLLVMLGGISFSMKKLQARARDEEEREGIRRHALISGTVASIAVLGMCFGTVFEWHPGVFAALWCAYLAVWDALVLFYLPRVTARRLAMERAEDPTAAARQRRDRLKVFAMVSYATVCSLISLGMMVYALIRG